MHVDATLGLRRWQPFVSFGAECLALRPNYQLSQNRSSKNVGKCLYSQLSPHPSIHIGGEVGIDEGPDIGETLVVSSRAERSALRAATKHCPPALPPILPTPLFNLSAEQCRPVPPPLLVVTGANAVDWWGRARVNTAKQPLRASSTGVPRSPDH